MRSGFSILELIVAFAIIAIISIFSIKHIDTSLDSATKNLLSQIKLAQNLALRDSRYFPNIPSTSLSKKEIPAINQSALNSLWQKNQWQLQFHLIGKYTTNSFSIYADTPRNNPTTNYDGRPMDGDIVAISHSSNKCISGYNNTNTSKYCTNNTLGSVRLKESFGIENLKIQAERLCKERDSSRIFFDNLGAPYCSRNLHKLTMPFSITLIKGSDSRTICILPNTGYSYISKKGC